MLFPASSFLKFHLIIQQCLQVYLFVDSHRVAGCLIAEPIKKAYKVLSRSLDGKPEATPRNKERPISNTLQFGELVFRRELVRRTSSASSSEVLEGGVILCEEEAIPALCGIRAIWVSPGNRRKSIASHLLDAAR